MQRLLRVLKERTFVLSNTTSKIKSDSAYVSIYKCAYSPPTHQIPFSTDMNPTTQKRKAGTLNIYVAGEERERRIQNLNTAHSEKQTE